MLIVQEIEKEPNPVYSKKPAEYTSASRADVEKAISSKYDAIEREEEKKTSLSSKEHALFTNLRDAVLENNNEKITYIKWQIISGKGEKFMCDINNFFLRTIY